MSMSTIIDTIYTPATTSYSDVLKTIININTLIYKNGTIAPTLDSIKNVRSLYELLGCPLDNLHVIHVTGTNGKGTTCWKLHSAFCAIGLKSGLFVSPHLSCFRERFRINEMNITQDDFVHYMTIIFNLCKSCNIVATQFELSFLMASLYFKESNCDVVVLEVGCGGDSDATNVINTSTLSIITSIGLDHTKVLGSTVNEIARRKGGIFKRNVNALVGPNCPNDVISEVAFRNQAILHFYEDMMKEIFDCSWKEYSIVDNDLINTNITIAALYLLKVKIGGLFSCIDINSTILIEALKQRPPCRWEVFDFNFIENKPIKVVLDIGHNPVALSALSQRIKRDFSHLNVHIIYAVSRDKDIRACLEHLLNCAPARQVYFTQTSSHKAAEWKEINEIFEDLSKSPATNLEAKDTEDLIRKVFELASSTPDMSAVVICGTCYIMPYAKRVLGIKESRDDDDLHAKS